MPRSHAHAQHFLRSPKLVAELVGHSNIRKNDTVYDLGAGSGVIASVLARRCKQVYAVEIEPNALKLLRKNVEGFENVKIIEKSIANIHPSDTVYKIFSNIPFHLSAEIVRQFVFTKNNPTSIYLIVQKQFARKLVPGGDHFTSELSAEIGPFYTARIRKPLRKTDFTPPPAVDTVLLELKKREQPLLQDSEVDNYRNWLVECFHDIRYFRSQPLSGANISTEKTPSQLTLDEWLQLWHYRSIREKSHR